MPAQQPPWSKHPSHAQNLPSSCLCTVGDLSIDKLLDIASIISTGNVVENKHFEKLLLSFLKFE